MTKPANDVMKEICVMKESYCSVVKETMCHERNNVS